MDQTSPRTPLTSKSSKTAKHLASLSDPKVRKHEKAFLIEGVKMVEEALRDGTSVRLVVATPALTQHHGKGVIKLAEQKGAEILWVSERLMDQLAESKTPQPVMAVAAMRPHTEEGLLTDQAALIVLCHQLQDPGNLGTIIRTAEAVGASGVAVTSNSVDPYNAKCVRASMGSILRLPVVKVADPHAFIGICKGNGYQTAALTLTGGRTLFQIDLKGPMMIIVGQEGAGLPNAIAETADIQVRIPMMESVDSLNAAVSTAVVLYEALRQRLPGSRA